MSDRGRHRGQAFGLTLDAGFRCPGLPPVYDGKRPVRVDLMPPAELLAGFPSSSERLWEVRDDDGQVLGRLDVDETAGYVLTAEGYGGFRIAADGSRIGCLPAPGPDWQWQRYLVGQVLPFVATLHGLEVLHASVIAYPNNAIAFLGPSRSGKSSMAVALALRGRRFLTDDVVAIEADPSRPHALRAHPGFGLTSVRHEVARRLPPSVLARLGPAIGYDEEAVRIALPVAPKPMELRALYFLQRGGPRGRARIEPIKKVDPRVLLGSGYNVAVRTPERLVRHLDLCARLAHTASFRLTFTQAAGLYELAATIDKHQLSVAA